MTTKDAKTVLKHPDRLFVLTALSFVNLTDKELQTLNLRHLRGHTQEVVAEEMKLSVNGVQKIEAGALHKCCDVWAKLVFVRSVVDK